MIVVTAEAITVSYCESRVISSLAEIVVAVTMYSPLPPPPPPSGSPVIPEEALTVALSASDPVRVVIVEASMIPVV